MRIVYFGSSGFSVPILECINDSSHEIIRVVTRPDKKTGRGRKVMPGIVKERAVEMGIDLMETDRIDADFMDALSVIDFDIAVVVSFGLIFPEIIFKDANIKWLNLHPSLLPKYRGPAPIISAILNGDGITGVSINDVVYKVDTGKIYAQASFSIGASDNKDRVEEKALKFGAPLIVSVLDLMEENAIEPFIQDEGAVTYTKKISSGDLKIDWEDDASGIINRIRAFSSTPGAYCLWKGKRLKVLEAGLVGTGDMAGGQKLLSATIPGEIITADRNSGVIVACKNNFRIKLYSLKPQGKKTMDALDFINGFKPVAGEKFE